MASILHRILELLGGRTTHGTELPENTEPLMENVSIAAGDPMLDYFKIHPGIVETDEIQLDSPALDELKENGVVLIAPLLARGELVGLLNLGPRMSTQDYSPDDLRLLDSLLTQAAPALRVAQLAELQKTEALKSERLLQELRVARLIQQTLLPKDLPSLAGWQVSAFYQPARAVGGDFYDFIQFENGKIGFMIADVTDKGMPAALLMATTRATLRSMAQRYASPGEVLRQTNEAICPDVPPSMFVTCIYALLDPDNGRLVFANAGHNLPYRRCSGEVSELRAAGMPLGLLPGMQYDETETQVDPGESLFLYTDGIVEAHNPQREMFGNPRLEADLRGWQDGSSALIDHLISDLADFTGVGWEQEDDITMLVWDREKDGSQA